MRTVKEEKELSCIRVRSLLKEELKFSYKMHKLYAETNIKLEDSESFKRFIILDSRYQQQEHIDRIYYRRL